MTLVVTWRTNQGIIMTADSAITDTKKREVTDYTRLKLLEIPYLNAGISFYGEAKINGKNTGIWIKDLIEENKKNITNIHDFANKLKDKANSEIGKIEFQTGFHIAGFSDVNDKKVAFFHHINNTLKNDYWDKRLRDNFEDDGSLDPNYLSIGKLIHNGDYLIFNRFLMNSMPLFEAIRNSTETVTLEFIKRKIKINTPFTADISGQKKIILIFLNIINQIYQQFSEVNPSKFIPGVGGKTSYILITEEGIKEYQKYDLNP
jgi:hypothetical protein